MSKARRKVTRMVLLAVSALGLCSTILLLTDPPPADLENTSAIFAMNTTTLTRSIASAQAEGRPSSETLLNLNCADANQVYETHSTRLRLKGASCTEDGNLPLTTQVRNKTNGYVATVFHRSPMDFTTDYINLREGHNEIDVKFQTEKGTVQKTVTIVRQPASTAQN